MIPMTRRMLACLAVLAACAALLPGCANASRARIAGEPVQGGLLVFYTENLKSALLDGRKLRVSEDGVFVVGFGRNAGPVELVMNFSDGHRETLTLKPRKRKYRIQRLTGLPRRKVTPNAEDMKRIRAEGGLIRAARAADTAETGFAGGFTWPAQGIVSGVYGSQRILNGKPRAPHGGTDVAAPTGTPVVAAAAGRVSLAHRDMFYTGNTVMIDHGHGLSTIYAHLSAIAVKEGQRVKKGQLIGRIGATGRVTGPHLHWGLSLFGTRLDPALAAGPMPKPEKKRKSASSR